MRQYIILSLCSDTAQITDRPQDFHYGFYHNEILAKATDDNFNDWSELVFSLGESVPVPTDLPIADIYNMICSWCVNIAFGSMGDSDSTSTLESVASQLDLINRGDEFRKYADTEYLHAMFAQRDWTDFEPCEYDTDEQCDSLIDYAIDEYLRESISQPFGTYSTADMRTMLCDIMAGHIKITGHTWY